MYSLSVTNKTVLGRILVCAANVSAELSLSRKLLMKIKWSHRSMLETPLERRKNSSKTYVQSQIQHLGFSRIRSNGIKLNIPFQYEMSEMESSK